MSFEVIIRVCGLSGIIASIGVMTGDILYFGRKESYNEYSINKRAIGLPFWRISAGKTLGVCLIPIVTLGFVPVYFALKPSGIAIALITSTLLGYAFAIGSSGHSFVAYSSIIFRAREGKSDTSPIVKTLDTILTDYKKLFTVEAIILITAFCIGSCIYSILILTGKTYLPMWMAVINPFILMLIARSSYKWLPSFIAGYVHPICMYIGVTPLQVLTIIYMWNK